MSLNVAIHKAAHVRGASVHSRSSCRYATQNNMMRIDNNALFFGNFVDAELKLIDLCDYLNDINKFISRKRRYKKKKYGEGVLKNIAIEMFSESFTSTLYNSVLISAWVFMEAEFKGYCNAMQKAKGIVLTYSDLKGPAILRFRNYTLKVLKLDLRLKDENWEDLKAINEIRNSLVHTDGSVGNKKLVNNFIKRHKVTGLLREENIVLSKNILMLIIMLFRLFIQRIYYVALESFPGEHVLKK